MNVSGRAPMACPKRDISAKPRVTKAARAFKPSPMPSASPVASAKTFLTAPPNSTPTQSLLVYTRRAAPCRACTSAWRTAAWGLAATRAHGLPCATSCAKLGPLSTPPKSAGATCCAISCPNRACSVSSSPLHNHATGVLNPASDCNMPRNAAVGVASSTRSCAAAKSLKPVWPSMASAPGSGTWGKYAALTPSRCSTWACCGRCVQSVVGCRAATCTATAVPQAPAPATKTRMAGYEASTAPSACACSAMA